MNRLICSTAVALLVLTGCSGTDDGVSDSTSAEPSGSTSPSASSSTSSTPTVELDEAFCDDAEALYARDAAISEAVSAVDPSTLTTSQLNDPDVYATYLAAIDLDGWESWHELYVQAAEHSGSAEMEAWIDVIVTVLDQQFAAFAEAAETATTMTEWSQSVTLILAEQDEIEVAGDEALRASEASMAACGVPLSVAAGQLLGYEG